MVRRTTSGSPWAIVFLGVVMTLAGVFVLAVPDAEVTGNQSQVGSALIGVGPAIAAFGAGAVRRHRHRFGGRVWTVAGFVILGAASVVVGPRLLGIALACLCLVAAGVTISRGVLTRRMSAPASASEVALIEVPAAVAAPAVRMRLDVIEVGTLTADAAQLDRLRRGMPERGTRMLYLWAFDEQANEGLIERWRDVGPVQLLRGGGALGGLGTLAATITGKLGSLIEETHDEVTARLATFDYGRGRNGRFAANSILCSDRTWRIALHDLIATTDVVQMDLAGFDEDNQGCTHELGLLVDRVAVDRVLLVADETTDLALLERVLDDAWSRMDPGSPNRGSATGVFVVVRAPLVGKAPGPDKRRAAIIERQELAVLQLMLERAQRA